MSYQQNQQKCQLPAKCPPKCPPKCSPQAPRAPASCTSPCTSTAPSCYVSTCCVSGLGNSCSLVSYRFPRLPRVYLQWPGHSNCCENESSGCSSCCHSSGGCN